MSTRSKKKSKSAFFPLLVIILLLAVISTIAVNVIFNNDSAVVPKVGPYYLYMQESDELEPDIAKDSLVFAREANNTSLMPGNKVMCYLSDGHLALRVIYNIAVNEDGSTSYFPGTAVDQGSELAIPRTNIFAVCKWYSRELFSYIRFATSVAGLMVLLVVPCVLLIVLLLVKIARSSREEIDEEDFYFDEEEAEQISRKSSKKAPLFDPEQANTSDEKLEKKKESLTQNFSAKPVNEDSPYQKSMQERTMKFQKIQQEDIERAKAEEAAKASGTHRASDNAGTRVYKTSELRGETNPNAKAAAPAVEPPTVSVKVKKTEDGRIEPVTTPKPAPAQVQAAAPAPKPASEPRPERHYSTPNIDDIINASELRAAKSGTKINREIAATDSIDDLISALEKEKKKL